MLGEGVALRNKSCEKPLMLCTLSVNPQLSEVEIIDILVYARERAKSPFFYLLMSVFLKIQYYKKLLTKKPQVLNDITAITELLVVRKPKC